MSNSLKKSIEIMKKFKISKQEPAKEPEVVEKGMTTQNFPRLAPRITPGLEVNTRNFSTFRDPFNGMPLVGELVPDYSENYVPKTYEDTKKSCVSHGRTYDISKGCYDCTILKSSMCKNCGDTMYKAPGGDLKCYKCAEGC